MVAIKKKITVAAKASAPVTKKPAAEKARLRVNDEWNRLLLENETRSKPLTNEQLVAAMVKLFPEKATKTTILRVSMVRSIFNKGTGMFRKFGPAGSKSRPLSNAYDAKGNIIEGRVGLDIKKPAAKAKPAPVKAVVKPSKKAKKVEKDTAYHAPQEEVIED